MKTVNKIPSINLPLTNEQGIIHPIWYEFLRSFISSVNDAGGGSNADNTVIAGDGIVGLGPVGTVNVGQGEGLLVGNNAVSVDITHQSNVQAAFEDEILIADASDQSRIRKTSLRDVANLSPGTFPGNNNLSVQYNNNGTFGGDNTFLTDGAGNITVTGSLTVDNININDNIFSTPNSSTPFIWNVPVGGLRQFQFGQTGEGSSACTLEITSLRAACNIDIRSDGNAVSSTADAYVSWGTNADPSKVWIMGLWDTSDADFALALSANNLGINTIFRVDRGSSYFFHTTGLCRSTTANITASTVQSQGQGELTADVNHISTCDNVNDTVTLPSAQAGNRVVVINRGAQTLQIFPASGDDLGAGVNASITLTTGSTKTFLAYDSTNWIQNV